MSQFITFNSFQKTKIIAFFILLNLCVQPVISRADPGTYDPGRGWGLFWSDEFSNNSLDTNVWAYDLGTGPQNDGFGTWQLAYMTSRTNNVRVRNGNLIIQVWPENFEGMHFTSGRIKTMDKKYFRYGKIAARIRLPFGYPLWPGFWLLGSDYDKVNWPACGEIDIMEMKGGVKNGERTVYGSINWLFEENDQTAYWKYSTGTNYLPVGKRLSDDYHVFEVEWLKDKIIWKMDGKAYFSQQITSSDRTEFHKPFGILFNIHVGGIFYDEPFPEAADVTAPMPQTMVVDWVRVYTNRSTRLKKK